MSNLNGFDDASLGIGDNNTELLGAGNEFLTELGTNIVGNLSTVLAVLDHNSLELSGVVDNNLVETVRQEVAGLGVGTKANRGESDLALPATTLGRVDTTGLSPRGLQNRNNMIRYQD